jgi:hypothetical protein
MAMAKLLDWCDEAPLAHWTQATPELPDWRGTSKVDG